MTPKRPYDQEMTYGGMTRWDLEPAENDPHRERARRQRDLALGYRLLAAMRWGDLGDGHISARDPERPDCLWLLRYGVSFHQATVGDLVLVDSQGVVIEGDGDVMMTAYNIHHPILSARPDVVSATHTHTGWGTPLAAEVRLVDPISQEACIFFEDQVIFDDERVEIRDVAGGGRIAEALGSNRVVILRNHGHLTVGASVAESVASFVAFERVAEVAMKATGAKPISADAAREAKAALTKPGALWQMYQFLLRRHVPDPADVLT